MSKSIKKMKQQFEELSLKMQFFCLSPNEEVYRKICANKKIQIDIGNAFEAWRMAVNVKHKYDEVDIHEFRQLLDKLYRSAFEHAKASTVDSIWYMFFATGDVNILQGLYPALGDTKLPKKTRETFTDQWIQFCSEYKKKITNMLKEPNETVDVRNLKHILSGFDLLDQMIEVYKQQAQQVGFAGTDTGRLEHIPEHNEHLNTNQEVNSSQTKDTNDTEETNDSKETDE